MAILSEVGDQLAVKLGVLLAHLNERQRRLLLEAEARLLGRGGVRLVARLTGVSEAKKREQLGRLPMGGREWHPKGEPVQVEDPQLLHETGRRPANTTRLGQVRPRRTATQDLRLNPDS
jgi:hypothetical protein